MTILCVYSYIQIFIYVVTVKSAILINLKTYTVSSKVKEVRYILTTILNNFMKIITLMIIEPGFIINYKISIYFLLEPTRVEFMF